jgi:hypothetical protein
VNRRRRGSCLVDELIELSRELDCRSIGSWLLKAAEAQAFWLQALRNPFFRQSVLPLVGSEEPDFECAALYILGELERRSFVIALDVDGVESGDPSVEFAMMVHLGFFVPSGQSYRVTVPETASLEKVQEAALRLASTATNLNFGPEAKPQALLHTVPQAEAEAWRSWILQMRDLNSDIFQDELRVAGPVRLRLSNAAFRIWMSASSEVGLKMQLARKQWVLFSRGA